MAFEYDTVPKSTPFALLLEICCLFLKCLWSIAVSIFYLFNQRPQKSVREDIVLVTGAGHGIGKEIAKKYASEGATVVCWDINKANNEATLSEISKLGYTKAYGYVCDVSDPEQVSKTAKQVQSEVGDITILINSAGVAYIKSILDSDIKVIEHTLNVNIVSHFWTIKAFLPAMKQKNRGHIVAISSIAGLYGGRNGAPYCASKFAVRGMMEALHEEFRADPKCEINTTTIFPAGVDTGMFKKVKIRFPRLLPVISPKEAADYIVSAQRQNRRNLSIPAFNLYLHNFFRTLPSSAQDNLLDFFNTHVLE